MKKDVSILIIGYARVSTADQSLDLQLDALKKYGCEKIYQEFASGAKDDRQELQRAMDILRKGDVFVVYKLDRLARSTVKLVSTLNELREIGVEFVSLGDNINTNTASGKAMFGMLSVFAEFERDVIRERVNAGLAAARARGRKGGRPKVDQKKLERAVKLYHSQVLSIKEIEKETSISRATLYRELKKQKND